MKIKKLVIYGFGKHENVTVELNTGMNVLYGLNEAGKTTIQQFILHILFGFPQRNSSILRYEPKSGGKYGGQLFLEDTHYGECIVERVRGKSAGDVSVYFPDGTSGGEEALKLLLRQYDRTSFESIFSFSLLQLQGFEKMGEEELSRTLLASGTTGVDSLLQIEKNMEKEMGELFKKSGRNPLMNVKIKELRQLELTLQEARETVKTYEPAIKRIQEIEDKLVKLEDKEKVCRNELQNVSLLRQYMPSYKKKTEIERKIQLSKIDHFPTDGIRRFELLVGKLADAKAVQQRVEGELSELRARIPENEAEVLYADIELLLAKESEWHQWNAQIATLENEVAKLVSLKNRLIDRLGMTLEQEEILFEANVSIRKEEELFELIHEMEIVDKQTDFVQSQLRMDEKELQEAQLQLEELPIPTKEEKERVREWPEIRQRLAEAKATISLEDKHKKETKKIPIIVFILALLCLSFGVIQQYLLLIISGVLIGAVGAYLLRGGGSKKDSNIAEMEEFIAKYSGQEYKMEQLQLRLNTFDQAKKQLEQNVESYQVKVVNHALERSRLNEKSNHVRLMYEHFIKSYGFDGLPSPSIVPQLFQIIREIQEVERDLIDKELQKKITRALIAERITEAEKLLNRPVSQNALYEILRIEHIRYTDEVEYVKRLKEQINNLCPNLNESILLMKDIENQLCELKEEAGVKTDEDFYFADEVYQQRIRLQEQLSDLTIQLELSGCLNSLMKHVDSDLNSLEAESKAALNIIEEEVKGLMNEKAKLLNQTDQLLTDETYSEKRQVFEMKKAELIELAKKWVAKKIVAEAIQRTMIELKEQKLPNVLNNAERLFSDLTGGNYEALQVTEDGFFVAVASNGMRYPIIELSQSTKEQAYISLRLALALSVYDTAPFPIIMDDPFVHFDDERLSRMIKLLHESPKHQFIYFTCHKKMKDKWPDAKIINVSAIGSDQKEFVQ